ncbi:MAG TPA: SH3-like domain-containing protein [Chloroflexota bacterium]|nr:SH3-like domain-containing protein [Chloroflexota bacterium]
MPEHRFKIGDHVRVLESNPEGNPRTPLHIRGKSGTVAALRGTMENPLDHRGVYPPLCTVEFRVGEVFGGESTDKVLLDLHEDWLEPA